MAKWAWCIGVLMACGAPQAAVPADDTPPESVSAEASRPPAPAAPQAAPAQPTAARPLSAAELRQARQGRRAALPTVNREMAEACALLPADSAEELLTRGQCHYDSGALGLAIVFWRQVTDKWPRALEATDAWRLLARTYNAAGLFRDAARAHAGFAERVGSKADKARHLHHALCIYWQLDDIRGRERTLSQYQRYASEDSDVASLCADAPALQAAP